MTNQMKSNHNEDAATLIVPHDEKTVMIIFRDKHDRFLLRI